MLIIKHPQQHDKIIQVLQSDRNQVKRLERNFLKDLRSESEITPHVEIHNYRAYRQTSMLYKSQQDPEAHRIIKTRQNITHIPS
jgi:hypothetical protein